jgi:hypothetical protein
MKICFILNPTSGRNRRRPALATHLRDFIASRSLDATVVTTDGPGHATRLARDAATAGGTTLSPRYSGCARTRPRCSGASGASRSQPGRRMARKAEATCMDSSGLASL